MSRLLNKIVFVTGASSGIGKATALEFAKHGSHLIISARRTERLQELKQEINSLYPTVIVHTLKLDVRYRDQVNEAVKSLPDPFKAIDVLVNNAGLVIGMDTVESVTDEAIDTIFDTNVKGLLYVTQAVLPVMKSRNSGHIINVSSIAAHEAYPGGGVYCASKHAVDALTRTLRMELVNTKINVSSIDPGLVETEFSIVRFKGDKNKADSVYRGMEPLTGQDIAESIVFTASRPPHVQIASMVIFPTNQAAVTMVHRDQV